MLALTGATLCPPVRAVLKPLRLPSCHLRVVPLRLHHPGCLLKVVPPLPLHLLCHRCHLASGTAAIGMKKLIMIATSAWTFARHATGAFSSRNMRRNNMSNGSVNTSKGHRQFHPHRLTTIADPSAQTHPTRVQCLHTEGEALCPPSAVELAAAGIGHRLLPATKRGLAKKTSATQGVRTYRHPDLA